jgi:hypothetical protein
MEESDVLQHLLDVENAAAALAARPKPKPTPGVERERRVPGNLRSQVRRTGRRAPSRIRARGGFHNRRIPKKPRQYRAELERKLTDERRFASAVAICCSRRIDVRAAGELAFAWAKASGMIGKAFLGPRVSRLFSVTVCPNSTASVPRLPPICPTRGLSAVLERRISERAVRPHAPHRVVLLLSAAAIRRLASAFEYASLSRCLAAAAAGERRMPAVPDLGAFSTLKYGE